MDTLISFRSWTRGPFISSLFVLVSDILSTMLTHALNSEILHGIPLRRWGKMYYLQFADDLIILTTRDTEDLRIIKLILYLLEDISGLAINLQKTCLYSSIFGHGPNPFAALRNKATPTHIPQSHYLR